MLHQARGIDAPQIEALAAGEDRNRNFTNLGRGKNEFGMRRRLLQRFQQRVESGAGQHVHFVKDVDLVPRRYRCVADRVINLPHIVDAVMRGGIHLDDVKMAALHDCFAMDTQRRHIDGRRGDGAVCQLVIERPGENPRSRGFAHPADAGEDPGLRNPAGLEAIRDRPHHGILTDQVIESRWAVFARQDAVGGLCRVAHGLIGMRILRQPSG